MKVHPLRWQGAAKSRAIQERLQAASRAWLSVWRSEDRAFDLAADIAGIEGADLSMQWLEACSDKGHALLGVRRKERGNLAAALARVSDGDSGAIASGIADQALHDFLYQIASLVTSTADIRAVDFPSPGRFERRHGALAFACDDPVLKAEIHLDDTFCRQLVPASAPPAQRLLRRSDVLGAQAVTFEVSLPLGSASLAGAQGFQVGQLLVTDTPLNAVIHLNDEQQRAFAIGTLVREGEARAIRLEGRPTYESQA